MSDRCEHGMHIDLECADCLALENERLLEHLDKISDAAEALRRLVNKHMPCGDEVASDDVDDFIAMTNALALVRWRVANYRNPIGPARGSA